MLKDVINWPTTNKNTVTLVYCCRSPDNTHFAIIFFPLWWSLSAFRWSFPLVVSVFPAAASVGHTALPLSRSIGPGNVTMIWFVTFDLNVDLFYNLSFTILVLSGWEQGRIPLQRGRENRNRVGPSTPRGQHEESSAVPDLCLRLSTCHSLPVPLDAGTPGLLTLW